MFKYIFLLSSILLFSCAGKQKTAPTEKEAVASFSGNLIDPVYLGYLFESPNAFGPIWNTEACKELNLQKISMFIKGGYLPNKIAEKLTYTFNSEGQAQDFAHYIYTKSRAPFSASNFRYANGKLTTIDILTYLDFSNNPPVFIKSDSIRTIAIASRSEKQSDSLIFYPSVKNPKVIVEIVNSFINSVEFFVEKGTNVNQLKALATAADSNLIDFNLSEKMVTYSENGLPIESYHLDSTWQKLEKAKSWDYNSKNQPIKYKEWLHGTQIKEIEISYNRAGLPSEILVDRKKYIFYTKSK